MNAYTKEDPITYLEANGYMDILRQAQFDGPFAYDYVFEAETGALSHALANSALFPQVTDAMSWGINADEPRAFDYNDFNQAAAYAADRYRASDHDPIILGLTLTVPATGPSVPATDTRSLVLLTLGLLSGGLYALRRARAVSRV
jgi:predicted extracellular nuclease